MTSVRRVISLAATTSGVNTAASIPQNVFAVEITTSLRDVVGRRYRLLLRSLQPRADRPDILDIALRALLVGLP